MFLDAKSYDYICWTFCNFYFFVYRYVEINFFLLFQLHFAENIVVVMTLVQMTLGTPF